MDTNKNIHLDQIGYLPLDKKRAVFTKNNTTGSFKVISMRDGKEIYKGELVGPIESKVAGEVNYIADFSAVTEEGEYKLIAEEVGESYSFKIGKHIYEEAFKESLRFFYMQKCGVEIPKIYGGKWAHPKCHMQKAVIYGTNKEIDVCGGWHDAGDYGRYVIATAKTIADLLSGYEANKAAFLTDINVPRRKEQLPYVLEEVEDQLNWMLKMQDAESGGVYHKVTGAVFPSFEAMPEEETHQLIVSPISSIATGSFAAAMALGYEYFKDIDEQRAAIYLATAEKAWTFLQTMPSEVFKNPKEIKTGEYGGISDLGHRLWASAQLFKATGKKLYKEDAESFLNRTDMIYMYDWSLCAGYGRKAYLQAEGADSELCRRLRSDILTQAEEIMFEAQAESYGTTNDEKAFIWGSNMYILMAAAMLMDAYEIEAKEEYLMQAKEYVHYVFGKNPLGICFLTGFGSFTTKNPHHRPTMAKKEAPVGMLAGGANIGCQDELAQKELKAKGVPAAKCYLDDYESFATNEVDIYWNSVLVQMLARLNLV